MGTSVTFNGTSYTIPASGELNWSALSNFLIDVGQHAALSTSGVRTLRVALTTPVTVAASTDYAIVCKLSSPGAVAVTLPAGVAGQIFVIHDGTGDAASNNITITPNGSETINGAATRVLSHNRGAITLQYSTTGTDWKVTDEFYPSGTIVSGDITGQIAVPKGGTGLAVGTDGGILAFTGTTTLASSGLLTASALIKGGGAGVAPSSLSLGTANQVLGMNNAATAYEHKTVAVGTTGSDFAVAHSANTVTLNLPDASASNRGAVTTGAQTFGGIKTLTTPIIKGITDASSIAAGNVGETGTVNWATTTTATSDTFVTGVASVTLAAGKYEITVQGSVELVNGATSTASPLFTLALRVSTTVQERALGGGFALGTSGTLYLPVTFSCVVNINGSTTYSLDIVCSHSSGTTGAVAKAWGQGSAISGSNQITGGLLSWKRIG